MGPRYSVISAMVLVALLAPLPARADSPLTSTPFHDAYLDVPLVARTAETRELDPETARFLADPEQLIGVKLAVVNALGWSLEGTAHAPAYLALLGRSTSTEAFDLAPHDALCVGYMLALDDYFHPGPALRFVDHAAAQMPRSLAAALVRALVRAQVAMESDWCQVWREVEEVLARAERGELDSDLRPEAVAIIVDYVQGYAEYCAESASPESMD